MGSCITFCDDEATPLDLESSSLKENDEVSPATDSTVGMYPTARLFSCMISHMHIL